MQVRLTKALTLLALFLLVTLTPTAISGLLTPSHGSLEPLFGPSSSVLSYFKLPVTAFLLAFVASNGQLGLASMGYKVPVLIKVDVYILALVGAWLPIAIDSLIPRTLSGFGFGTGFGGLDGNADVIPAAGGRSGSLVRALGLAGPTFSAKLFLATALDVQILAGGQLLREIYPFAARLSRTVLNDDAEYLQSVLRAMSYSFVLILISANLDTPIPLGRLLPGWVLPSGFIAPAMLTCFSAVLGGLPNLLVKRGGKGSLFFGLGLFLVFYPVLHMLFINHHSILPTGRRYLDAKLEVHEFRLLDRAEGQTGYISVLENLQAGWRVMRCDHSLLGGEWLVERGVVGEPVYGIFVLLEAVRLARTIDSTGEALMSKPTVSDSEASALLM